mmetsp:Transcript_25167/g.74837  ORF Transcript_25167/g.74837 Transcript_25167/m.74837 type:complete len:361 (-) Transcript_25167:216-1298(-)
MAFRMRGPRLVLEARGRGHVRRRIRGQPAGRGRGGAEHAEASPLAEASALGWCAQAGEDPAACPAPQRGVQGRRRGGARGARPGRGLAGGGLRLVPHGRREGLLHHEPEPAHPAVLRLVLGARHALSARGPHQDQAPRPRGRDQPLGAARAQLHQRRQRVLHGLLPRGLLHQRVPLVARPVAGDRLRSRLRVGELLHGLLLRLSGRILRILAVDVHAAERGADLQHVLVQGRPVRRPEPLPERHDLRLGPGTRKQGHGPRDPPPRAHLVRDRRELHPELHGRHHRRHARRIHRPRCLRHRLGHGREERAPLLVGQELLGRVLGRDGLRPRRLRLAAARDRLHLGRGRDLHRRRQPGYPLP